MVWIEPINEKSDEIHGEGRFPSGRTEGTNKKPVGSQPNGGQGANEGTSGVDTIFSHMILPDYLCQVLCFPECIQVFQQ
jgi:hypothetical protein